MDMNTVTIALVAFVVVGVAVTLIVTAVNAAINETRKTRAYNAQRSAAYARNRRMRDARKAADKRELERTFANRRMRQNLPLGGRRR